MKTMHLLPVPVLLLCILQATTNINAQERGGTVSPAVTRILPDSAALECQILFPPLIADTVNLVYSPMPFTLRAVIRSTGVEDALNVYAVITLPPQAKLAGSDAPSQFIKPLSLFFLSPGKSDTVSWQIEFPTFSESTQLQFQVAVYANNATTTTCKTLVIMRGLRARFRPTCSVPFNFVRDLAPGAIKPNPFQVGLVCTNVDSRAANAITASIVLPPGGQIVLDGSSESYLKTLSPDVLYPGASTTVRMWNVRYVGTSTEKETLPFRFIINGRDVQSGNPLPQQETHCDIVIPPDTMERYIICGLAAPDTLESDGFVVAPNPVTITSTVYNRYGVNRLIRYLDLDIPAAIIDSIDPATPLYRDLNREIKHNDSLVVQWNVKFKTSRNEATAELKAFGEMDGSYSILCGRGILIEPLLVLDSCSIACSETQTAYNPATRSYDPSKWTVTATLKNVGGLTLTKAYGRIESPYLVNPHNFVELDPTVSGNSNVKRTNFLPPGETASFTWSFRVKQFNRLLDTADVCFTVVHGSEEIGAMSSGCEVCLRMAPVNPADASPLPDAYSVRLDQNTPNPVFAGATISFHLPASGQISLVLYDLLGRPVSILADGYYELGEHRVGMNGAALPEGVYFYQLRASSATLSRALLIRR